MLLSVSEVLLLVPVSRATLYNLMNRNDFPRPVKITKRVFWESEEIESWVKDQKDLRQEVV